MSDPLPAPYPSREELGQLVRKIWIEWAGEQAANGPVSRGWLLPWDQMSEDDREVDRRIGARLFQRGVGWVLGNTSLEVARQMWEEGHFDD